MPRHTAQLRSTPTRRGRRRRAVPVLAVCIAVPALLTALLSVGTALAAIYQCPTGDGGVTYQDVPCPITPKTAPAAAADKSALRAARAVRPPPAGIHKSWFVLPEHARNDAFCDRSGCECGTLRRSFDSSLDLAVADALYLDGQWHRYDSAVREWQAAEASTADFFTWQDAVEDASCDVRMSQQTLSKYLLTTLRELKEARFEAESFGYTDIEDCTADRPAACDYVDKVMLYERIVADLKALQTSRPGADENPVGDALRDDAATGLADADEPFTTR